jgi:hypothetical protein
VPCALIQRQKLWTSQRKKSSNITRQSGFIVYSEPRIVREFLIGKCCFFNAKNKIEDWEVGFLERVISR